MDVFLNKLIQTQFGKIEVSRVIASWHNMNGKTGMNYRRNREFDKWMESIDISEEDRRHIMNFAGNGKIELEVSAGRFMHELKKSEF